MKLFIVSPGQDLAGIGYRTKRAFDKYTDWEVRSMHVTDTYIRYPYDLKYSPPPRLRGETREEYEVRLETEPSDLNTLYAAADVVHHNDSLHFHSGKKPTVLQHHGSVLRDDPEASRAKALRVGATELVSTVDLLEDAPGATWVPAPYDLDWIRDKYQHERRSPFRVGHMPTSRAIKSTDLVIRTVEKFKDVELELTENKRWIVSLARKSECEIVVDQLKLGYGCNAVEAWALSIPVIAGFAEPADRERFLEETGEKELPFYEASDADFEQRLGELIDSPQLRREYGQRGRDFAERFHSEQAVVGRLKPIYEAVAGVKRPTLLEDIPELVKDLDADAD